MAKTPSIAKQAASRSSGVVARAGGGKGPIGGAPPAFKAAPMKPGVNGSSGPHKHRGKPKSGQMNGMC